MERPAVGTEAGAGVEPAAEAVSLADRKRLKHREYVKRSYNKKITTIATLKRELQALEQQYQTILHSGNGHEASSSALESESPQLHKYLIATELKNRQQLENERLYQLNADHMKVESRLSQLLDCSKTPPLSPSPSPSLASRFHIRPLPAPVYAEIVSEATADVLSFRYRRQKLSSGTRVLGWTDQREVCGSTLKFALQKVFPGLSPSELLRRSWAIFASPEQFSKVYGSALNTDFHVLQTVDADTLLLYRRIKPRPNNDHVVKTIFLLARRPVSEGYLLLFRSIDKELLHFQELEVGGVPFTSGSESETARPATTELWADMYIWVLFNQVDERPDQCLFHFGGATTTSLWLQEVLFIALRWESMAVGPQFCLTAE